MVVGRGGVKSFSRKPQLLLGWGFDNNNKITQKQLGCDLIVISLPLITCVFEPCDSYKKNFCKKKTVQNVFDTDMAGIALKYGLYKDIC